MLAPLSHLDDCAGNHYRLQLNAYRYILQKYYDVSVKAMLVVGTHPDNGDEPFIDYVPILQEETEQFMQYQRIEPERRWQCSARIACSSTLTALAALMTKKESPLRTCEQSWKRMDIWNHRLRIVPMVQCHQQGTRLLPMQVRQQVPVVRACLTKSRLRVLT